MQQAVLAGSDLEERAVVFDATHDALVLGADLRLECEAFDDFDRLLERLAIRRRDADRAIVADVDLRAGLLGDRLNHLAAGSDDHADLVGLDLEGLDARRVLRKLRTWRRHDLVHLFEDVESTFARLVQGFVHDLLLQPGDLDVHLDGGNALVGSADLEIHVAEMILVTEDVRQDGVLLALHDEAHRDAGDRCLDGHASVHHRQASATDGRHRRRAVRLRDLRDDTHRVGEVFA